jgi:alpha-L-fucosidase
MTLAGNWGYVPGDRCKSSAKVIHTLVEVVAKGGSLLLGVGPKPDGTLPEEAVERLQEVGKWMDKNGAALYNTRITPNYHDGNTWFTQNKKEGIRYAIVCLPEQQQPAPGEIAWQQNFPKKGSKVKLLQTGETVKWKRQGDTVRLYLPASIVKSAYPALAFSFVPADEKRMTIWETIAFSQDIHLNFQIEKGIK